MRLLNNSLNNKAINFAGVKTITWSISIVICLISLVSLIINGLNLSLEFTGGMQLEVRFEQPTSISYIQDKLHGSEFKSARIQRYGSTKDFLIRIASASDNTANIDQDNNLNNKVANKVISVINSKDNNVMLRQVERVGSEVGEKLVEQGAIAVIIAILATMLYIVIRFEYRLAISAAITLCHNSIIVLGCFSLTKYEFDLATLAAILAIIGYSLNDTIVIFDRVRENFRKYHRDQVKDIVNRSINQTLSRTIMTSLLTLLVVLSLLFTGGQSLFGFALALTIGIIIGTYASICIAGTVAMWMGLSRQDFLKT